MLRPVMDVIERAHPGIVELTSSTANPGFAVRLAERPFPKKLEGQLREAVAKALDAGTTLPPSPVPPAGLFARILQAIRSVFRS
jgi:hypothetical protein